MTPMITSEPAGFGKGSFLTRTATAAGYGLLVVAALWWGVWPTAVLFGLMAAFATAEIFNFLSPRNRIHVEKIAIVAAASLPLAAAAWGSVGTVYVLTAMIFAVLSSHVFAERTRTPDLSGAIFAAAYTGFLLAYLVLMRRYEDGGRALTLILVLSVWASDVLAYLVGSAFGRHRLAPRISPKKSWEGFVAGLFGCMGIWALATLVPGLGLALPLALATGLGVGIAAVLGDLAESRMKREAGVKDSGASLPGHGGFLDRLDSLILAGVAAYWILYWGGFK